MINQKHYFIDLVSSIVDRLKLDQFCIASLALIFYIYYCTYTHIYAVETIRLVADELLSSFFNDFRFINRAHHFR